MKHFYKKLISRYRSSTLSTYGTLFSPASCDALMPFPAIIPWPHPPYRAPISIFFFVSQKLNMEHMLIFSFNSTMIIRTSMPSQPMMNYSFYLPYHYFSIVNLPTDLTIHAFQRDCFDVFPIDGQLFISFLPVRAGVVYRSSIIYSTIHFPNIRRNPRFSYYSLVSIGWAKAIIVLLLNQR